MGPAPGQRYFQWASAYYFVGWVWISTWMAVTCNAFVLRSRTMHVTTMIQACRGTVSHIKRNRFDGFGQSD